MDGLIRELLCGKDGAVELQYGQIQFGDGPQMSFLIELDSFNRLYELMKSNTKEVVDVLFYNPGTRKRQRPSGGRVSSDKIGYMVAYSDGRWFLVNGIVYHIPQEDVDEFGEGTQ